MATELPTVRRATYDEMTQGKTCQSCQHWIRYENSYVWGLCIVAGVNKDPVRWTDQLDLCDGFKRE